MHFTIQFRQLIASICACFVASSARAYLLRSVWIWLISQMLSTSGKYVMSSSTSLNSTFRFMTFTSGEWTNIFFNSQRSLTMSFLRNNYIIKSKGPLNALVFSARRCWRTHNYIRHRAI